MAELSQEVTELNSELFNLTGDFNLLLEDHFRLSQTTTMLQDDLTELTGRLHTLNETSRLPDEEYDYVIFQHEGIVKAKNAKTDSIDFSSNDACLVLNQAIAGGSSVYVMMDNYSLSSDVIVENKSNFRLCGQTGTKIVGNGNKIVIKGLNYAYSKNNLLSGFTVVDGTLRIENSFRTTITNMIFEECSTAIELVNTETWSEATKIEDSHFSFCSESIVFRTNTTGATGSYGNTEISRCYFNLFDDSVGIKVEPKAEFSTSLLSNLRIWIGEHGYRNQTGILIEGSMSESILSNVVFESFIEDPFSDQIYAIRIGETANTLPILGPGTAFLGVWDAKVQNSLMFNWISGIGSIFKRENISLSIGLDDKYQVTEISAGTLTIAGFSTKIQVQGEFAANETITVRFSLEFVDNTSTNVTKQFKDETALWLSQDDLLELFPSQNIISAIKVYAKTNQASTNATVLTSIFGAAT